MTKPKCCLLSGLLCVVWSAVAQGEGVPDASLLGTFAIDGQTSLLQEQHCGIVNGKLTINTPYRDVMSLGGLWAPPYVSSDFRLTVSIAGKRVPTSQYTWWPMKIERRGQADDVYVCTTTVLVPGRRDTRYTMQMYKLFASGVLDAEEEAGLMSHLNQREFLSAYGFHSMSKLDVAYDQVDIDNGGGGSCTCFPPQIAERFYKAGYPRQAEDILGRILWWGQRMPYWGDSLVGNEIDYRKDTPLQCTLDGVTVAQCIVFGLFGVDARFNGSVRVFPQPPIFAPQVRLRGLKLRGHTLDIDVNGERYRVVAGDKTLEARVGQSVIVTPDGSLRLGAPEENQTIDASCSVR